jgi:hypothetical protein
MLQGFLKDNPSYEMQFLRGKMLAVQKAMECRDALLQTSEEQVVADPDKCLSAVKKETECSKSTAPNGQQQPVSSDTQKRKVDEVPPDTEVKRIKISATLKTDCKPDMSKTSIPDKDTKKIVVKPDIKDNKIDTSEVEDEIKRTVNKPVEAKSEMVKGSMTKKSVKAVPDKPDKSSWTSRDRTPERYRDKFDQRSRNRRDSPDRWKSGSRDDWGSDRKRLSPKRQLGPRKISPAIYRPQEDKKRSSASRAKEEKSKDVEVVHIKDSPSPKRETPKEGSGKGYSTLPSPSSIPLPEKPVSRLIAPFSLRNSKLVKSQQKPAGAMQAGDMFLLSRQILKHLTAMCSCNLVAVSKLMYHKTNTFSLAG